VAALREDKTFNESGSQFGVHPVVISDWKQQALLARPGVFGQKAQRDAWAADSSRALRTIPTNWCFNLGCETDPAQ